jgi:hypothetical protein
MPSKNDKAVVSSAITKLFEIAESKMHDENDKKILEGLRKLVG